MATYTDPTTFQRDFYPTGAGETLPRLIERGATMAYNTINARLNGVYAVPFSPTPGIIVDISDMLTKCNVKALQSGNVPMRPKKDAPDSPCKSAYEDLDKLASGAYTIPGVAVLAGTSGYHTRDGVTPVFDMDDSINHQPDPDLIDQIESERR